MRAIDTLSRIPGLRSTAPAVLAPPGHAVNRRRSTYRIESELCALQMEWMRCGDRRAGPCAVRGAPADASDAGGRALTTTCPSLSAPLRPPRPRSIVEPPPPNVLQGPHQQHQLRLPRDPSFAKTCGRCHRTVLALRPVAAATSRIVCPRADSATRLSAGVRPSTAPTRSGSQGRAPRWVDHQYHRPIRLDATSGRPGSTGLTCTMSHGSPRRRPTGIEPLMRGPPGNGNAAPAAPRATRVTACRWPLPVRQPVSLAQKCPRYIVGRRHPPATVQLDDARRQAAEQLDGRCRPRPRVHQRLPHPHELTQMRQEALHRPHLPRRPAVPLRGVGRRPDDATAVRPVEPHVEAVPRAIAQHHLVEHRRRLLLLVGEQRGVRRHPAVRQRAQPREALVPGVVVLEVLALPFSASRRPRKQKRRKRTSTPPSAVPSARIRLLPREPHHASTSPDAAGHSASSSTHVCNDRSRRSDRSSRLITLGECQLGPPSVPRRCAAARTRAPGAAPAGHHPAAGAGGVSPCGPVYIRRASVRIVPSTKATRRGRRVERLDADRPDTVRRIRGVGRLPVLVHRVPTSKSGGRPPPSHATAPGFTRSRPPSGAALLDGCRAAVAAVALAIPQAPVLVARPPGDQRLEHEEPQPARARGGVDVLPAGLPPLFRLADLLDDGGVALRRPARRPRRCGSGSRGAPPGGSGPARTRRASRSSAAPAKQQPPRRDRGGARSRGTAPSGRDAPRRASQRSQPTRDHALRSTAQVEERQADCQATANRRRAADRRVQPESQRSRSNARGA